MDFGTIMPDQRDMLAQIMQAQQGQTPQFPNYPPEQITPAQQEIGKTITELGQQKQGQQGMPPQMPGAVPEPQVPEGILSPGGLPDLPARNPLEGVPMSSFKLPVRRGLA